MCFWTCSQSILIDAQEMSVHDNVDNDVKNQNGGLCYIPGWCHRPWSDLFMNKNTGVRPTVFTPQSSPLSPKPPWPPYEPSRSRKVRRMRVDPTNIWWPRLSSSFFFSCLTLPHVGSSLTRDWTCTSCNESAEEPLDHQRSPVLSLFDHPSFLGFSLSPLLAYLTLAYYITFLLSHTTCPPSLSMAPSLLYPQKTGLSKEWTLHSPFLPFS